MSVQGGVSKTIGHPYKWLGFFCFALKRQLEMGSDLETGCSSSSLLSYCTLLKVAGTEKTHFLRDVYILFGERGMNISRPFGFLPHSFVQWHPFSLFLGGCPTKNGVPQQGFLFFQGH